MYPSSHGDHHKYAQGYAGANAMNIQPTQPYHSSYTSHGAAAAAATRWSTGLGHCCDDPANCLITCFCPCITFGQIAEMVNQGSISCVASGVVYGLLGLTGLSCLYSCVYRSRLRAQYDLEEAPCADCLVHFCCETCALCQEYRELRTRGFDMGIGMCLRLACKHGKTRPRNHGCSCCRRNDQVTQIMPTSIKHRNRLPASIIAT